MHYEDERVDILFSFLVLNKYNIPNRFGCIGLELDSFDTAPPGSIM